MEQRLKASEGQLAEMSKEQVRQDAGVSELERSSEIVLKIQHHKVSEIGEQLQKLSSDITALQGRDLARHPPKSPLHGERLGGIQALAAELLRGHEAEYGA